MSGQHQRLPLEVDPFRLATRGEHLQGTIPLKQMKRLVSTLESDAGSVAIDITFSVDLNRVPLLSGHIEAGLQQLCQRCMNEMTTPVSFSFELALVRSEAEMEMLPEGYEATLVEETPMMLSDLIEDEMLLALPAVARHSEQECQLDVDAYNVQEQAETETNTEDVRQDNPFDILANLKKD